MINNEILSKVLNIHLQTNTKFDSLGLIDSKVENTLSFIDDSKYIKNIINNENISAVFITNELATKVQSDNKNIQLIICKDPRLSFYSLYNYISKQLYIKKKTIINNNSFIHPSANIAEYNVIIGENVIIEPNVTILPDVIIGDNVILRAGSVIGSEGFEHKRTTSGILSVFHSGKVIINSNVEIGSNSCIDKGFSFRDTIINKNTKIDNLVHIAHCVEIGENCLIAASAMIAGSTTIGNDVWIGPSASISNNISVGNGCFITLGAVVVKDVAEGQKVTGNFAIPHDKFINNLKKSL